MISKAERNDLVESLKENIDKILRRTTEELIREEDLGKSLSFKPSEETLDRIFLIIKELKRSEIEKIPYNRLESLHSEIGEFGRLMASIMDYTPNQTGSNSRESIMEKIENYYNTIFANVVPLISFINCDSDMFERRNKELDDLVSTIKNTKSEIVENKTKVLSEADSILKNLRDTASESGVTKYSEIFANEATENKKKANNWLIATIVLGTVSIIIAYFFLTITPASAEPNYYEIVHFALTKIIVFSILYYLLMLFVKNYNAQRHNYVVNKHRQNALTTFGTFMSSSKDTDTKNAVLLQTTHSIFSAQTSGYLKNEIDSEPSQKLIEIIRAGNNSINK